MQFDKTSQVTIVITSCGRFELLEKTLTSLDEFNNHPVYQIIITEDSGDERVREFIPSSWQAHTKILLNKPKLGQIRSIDLAYSHVTTPYIFHCEDDWEFYRNHFIEDSLALLENNSDIVQVGLRSYFYDLRIHYAFLEKPIYHHSESVSYFTLSSQNQKQQGFGFNPGLRRLVDYQKFAPFDQFENHPDGAESHLSQAYAKLGMRTVYLSSDAVSHIGWGQHVLNDTELKKFNRRKFMRTIRGLVAFVVGAGIGYWLATL